MSKPVITIHIDGPQGSGKSLIAEHLATYFKILHGKTVSIEDSRDANLTAHNPLPRIPADTINITVEQK